MQIFINISFLCSSLIFLHITHTFTFNEQQKKVKCTYNPDTFSLELGRQIFSIKTPDLSDRKFTM